MHNGASYYTQVIFTVPGKAGPGNLDTQFTWDDQPKIRYARVQHIEALLASDLATCYPGNVALLPDNQANLVSIVLETNDPDDITGLKGKAGQFQGTLQTQQGIGLTQLRRLQNVATNNSSFVRHLFPYKDMYVQWQKSFINISPGGLANTTPLAIVLGVWYTWTTKDGLLIDKNKGGLAPVQNRAR